MKNDNTTPTPEAATPKSLAPLVMTLGQFRNLIDADRVTADLTYEGEELEEQKLARVEFYSDYSGGGLIALYDATDPNRILVLSEPPGKGARRLAAQILSDMHNGGAA